MWIRLRQICVVASDLNKTGLDIGAVLGLEACYIDPGVTRWGLKNTLWPIGNQFLEVVTPTAEDTTAGRYMARRGGADTGYMVITHVDDVPRRIARANELGVRVAFEHHVPEEGQHGVQLHPADTGGALFEFDQMLMERGDEVGGPWNPAGRHWKPFVRTELVERITAAVLQSPDPDVLARRWADIAEAELTRNAAGHAVLEFENAHLRFVPETDGRGEGLSGLDIEVTDRDAVLAGARSRGCYVSDDEVEVGGLRINLLDRASN